MAEHHFFTVRISTNPSNSMLVHFVSWLFRVLQTLANQWVPNYHVNTTYSNILSLDVLLPTPASSHTFGLIALYHNTLEQIFEAKKSNFRRGSM